MLAVYPSQAAVPALAYCDAALSKIFRSQRITTADMTSHYRNSENKSHVFASGCRIRPGVSKVMHLEFVDDSNSFPPPFHTRTQCYRIHSSSV